MENYAYKKIDAIEFGFFSPNVIKKMATVKIVTPELYDKEGYPVDGGLMDTRLGVIDPGLRCKSCGGRINECLGHFGYIELARPVIHIKMVNLILTLLRTTCKSCSRVLLPEEQIKKLKEKLKKTEELSGIDARRRLIKELIKTYRLNKCPHCGQKQKKISLEKPTTFMEEDVRISPIEVRARLEQVPDSDLDLFGINPDKARPEWFVLTILPIPPVTMRPSITLESGERSEDDLTHKLSDIVKINQRLFENVNAGVPELVIEDLWELLQYHITTYFDNAVAQVPPARHRSGQPLKTITERIKSKEGRIRHNLAGKRTNFSARTVISPDPRLKINEVGVPEDMAIILTIPEKATEWNIEYLKQYVINGPDNYPGATYIIRPDGKRKRITDENKEAILEELQPGYLIERHLINGDAALFNRQPTLHRMGMMHHKVKVLPHKTFRINPSVAAPYNADFDGDEMNLHIPQTEEARIEASILMDVKTQIISPRYGLAIISCLQDSISGNYILTADTEFTRQDAIDMLASVGVTDFSRLPKGKVVDGKDILSVILPKDFDYIGESSSGDELVIKKGKFIKGTLDKANLGEGKGLLLRNIHKQYGPDVAMDFLDKVSKLGIKVLMNKGFSTTLSDLDLNKDVQNKIKVIIDKAENETHDLIQKYKDGKLQPYPGKTMKETLEMNILVRLNKARDEAGKITAEFGKQNTGMSVMQRSGSRGNKVQFTQMAASVGQQAFRGGRISKGYKGRTLSFYEQGDLGTEAHGFVRNGFNQGLTPQEFFFMSITARDSLMDTALRTPKSGYLYRRLANALQDVRVENDCTVRDSSNKIIQFKYGEDGIDVSKSEGGKINVNSIIHKVLNA